MRSDGVGERRAKGERQGDEAGGKGAMCRLVMTGRGTRRRARSGRRRALAFAQRPTRTGRDPQPHDHRHIKLMRGRADLGFGLCATPDDEHWDSAGGDRREQGNEDEARDLAGPKS
jgi:hypothetical protein